MTDRERVARAIYGAAFENQRGGKSPEPGWCWERSGPVQQAFATRQATAALDAMLEPSDGALNAGGRHMCEAYDCKCDLEKIWQAMIRFMREEKDG